MEVKYDTQTYSCMVMAWIQHFHLLQFFVKLF